MCVKIPLIVAYTSYSTDFKKHLMFGAKITPPLMSFNENENNYVKMIIPSYIKYHFAIAASVKKIAIRYFFKIVKPF